MAQRLAELCRSEIEIWRGLLGTVQRELCRRIREFDLDRWAELLESDWTELLGQFTSEALLLAGMALGMPDSHLAMLAEQAQLELVEALSSSATGRDEDLADRLRQQKQELHDLRDELRLAKRENASLGKRLEAARQSRREIREELSALQDEIGSSESGGSQEGEATRQRIDELAQLLAKAASEQADWQEERAGLLAELDSSRAQCDELLQRSDAVHSDDEDDVWDEKEAAYLRDLSQERTLRQKAEEAFQDASREIINLRSRLRELQLAADALPRPTDAPRLLELLDAAVSGVTAQVVERLASGHPGEDDQLILEFASRVVEFRRALSRPEASPVGSASDDAASDGPLEASPPTSNPSEHVNATTLEPESGQPPGIVAQSQITATRRSRTRGWTVRPIGGASEIGGSAIVATTPDERLSLLLDCGQRMPAGYGEKVDTHLFHYGVAGVSRLTAILVSHAHLDHIGSLPVLLRSPIAPDECPVYATEPTAKLAEIMLKDSARIQNSRENLTQLGESDLAFQGRGVQPAYNEADVVDALQRIVTQPPDTPFEVAGSGVIATFVRVPHVLGSAAIRLEDEVSGRSLLYSGDLGPIRDQMYTLPDFGGVAAFEGADLVLMESTYGLRPENVAGDGRGLPGKTDSIREQEINRLVRLLRKTVGEHGGFALLPSFALGKVQELCSLLGSRWGNELPAGPVYIAGMGERILELYSDYVHSRARGGVEWVRPGQFPRTESLHRRLDAASSFDEVATEVLGGAPGYIVATPAMMGGGWSQLFAERMVESDKNAIAFTGYLPLNEHAGYALARLKRGSQFRRLHGAPVKIESAWERIYLSSHAPFADLVAFAEHMGAARPGCAFGLIHGTRDAQMTLAKRLRSIQGVGPVESLGNSREWSPVVT